MSTAPEHLPAPAPAPAPASAEVPRSQGDPAFTPSQVVAFPAIAPPAPTVELRGPVATVRSPREEDVAPLVQILAQPEVAHWWVGYSEQEVRADFYGADLAGRVIEVGGRCAGGMLVLRGQNPEYPTTVIHLFLGLEFRGNRVGEEALALAIRDEFAAGITRVTLDPNAKNEGAIRSYERLGFVRVGVLRDYQRRPDGSLDDAVFLDLTRRDFPQGPPLPLREG